MHILKNIAIEHHFGIDTDTTIPRDLRMLT